MPSDDLAGAWAPIAPVQVPAEATLQLVEFALAGHASAYYQRLRTYQAGAPAAARVRVVGPFADGESARTAVQDLIGEVRRDLAGVVCPARAQETRAEGPASPGGTPERIAPQRAGLGQLIGPGARQTNGPSFSFDAGSGELRLLDQQRTVAPDYAGPNEPAEVRVHPDGNFVYVNNRGEDSVAWFRIGAGGELARRGHVPLAKSIHPGLAARNFTFAPGGSFVLVADRPADLIRSYAIDRQDGSLHPLTEASVLNPAFIAFAERK